MKKIIIIAMMAALAIALTGCSFNRQIIDVTYGFKYAVLNGETIEIKSWKDFDNSDQIQFTDVNGITYLTHSSNVILMTDIHN